MCWCFDPENPANQSWTSNRSRLLWSFMLKSYGIRWNERNGIPLISCRFIAALLNISNQEAEIKEIGMIGPATVGGIKTTPWKTRQTRLCGLQWKSVFLDQGLGAFALATQARWRFGQWLTDCWRTQVVCWTMWSCRDFIALDQSVSPALLLSFFRKSMFTWPSDLETYLEHSNCQIISWLDVWCFYLRLPMSPSLEVCQMNWSAKLVFALANLDVLPPCLSPGPE